MAKLNIDINKVRLRASSEFDQAFVDYMTKYPTLGVPGLAEQLDVTEDEVMGIMLSLMRRGIITVHWPDWLKTTLN
jgi:hypothetical protein